MADHQFALEFTGLAHTKRPSKGRGTIPDSFMPNQPFFLRHLLYRNSLNMTTILLIVGQIRTGKSWLGLKLCEQYCKAKKIPFNATQQFGFKLDPFLEWSMNAMDNIYLLDEIGRSVPPSEWWSLQSKIFRNFIDTQGFRRNVLIMTLPNAKGLLNSVKTNVNYAIVTKYQGYGLIFKQTTDAFTGKPYYFYLGGIKSDPPAKHIVDHYESEKKKQNDEWLMEDLGKLKEKKVDPLKKFQSEETAEFGSTPLKLSL